MEFISDPLFTKIYLKTILRLFLPSLVLCITAIIDFYIKRNEKIISEKVILSIQIIGIVTFFWFSYLFLKNLHIAFSKAHIFSWSVFSWVITNLSKSTISFLISYPIAGKICNKTLLPNKKTKTFLLNLQLALAILMLIYSITYQVVFYFELESAIRQTNLILTTIYFKL
ncbi:hypothetical protein D0T49_01585 [Paludibacter sp. 221]|uniref:hypothetical protein n=1 Tax=Paludibacter sp. 221 TaxID=2302939 RepID=UPI0013CFD7FC|nr:hypothetical protein [Paludibacter sp. 221]NDV45742.1 hypothetical protein [Paludibacter sp. 221]